MTDRPIGIPNSNRAIRSIVIVGGGTAGWMAATLLAARLEGRGVRITVVESSAIRTVGVGEATTPAIRDYFAAAGIGEADVLRASQGTIKLGIRFDGWSGDDSRFFHPFGLHGMPSNGVAFHHYWLKRRAGGDPTPFDRYSLCSHLADSGRFIPPSLAPKADWQVFDWAVHFDAGLFANFLAEVSTERGVRHVDARVRDVRRDGETGHIVAIDTEEAGEIEGDLFVDCTGFRSLLLGQALGTPFVDWTHLLPCDRAVAIPCAHGGPADPYTRATARAAGWQWRIPLQHRVGNGYVFSSRHISDDEAVATLQGNLQGEPLADPNLLRFATGHRESFWRGNCVALGLAAGFMEPLESTSITLIHSGIERLLQLFPERDCDPALADEFNRITTLEYQRVRDFLLLHYWGNARHGEPFWDAMRALTLPDALAHKIRLFRARGALVRYEWESFQDPSWLAIYAGLGILPDRWDPMADYFPPAEIAAALARIRGEIDREVTRAVPHLDFLRANLSPVGSGTTTAAVAR